MYVKLPLPLRWIFTTTRRAFCVTAELPFLSLFPLLLPFLVKVTCLRDAAEFGVNPKKQCIIDASISSSLRSILFT